MLVVTMAMSTFVLFAFAVVASDLEEEFGLSKLQLGLLGAVNTGMGGIFAPTAGRLSDRLGGRRSMAAVLSIAAVTMGFAALAQTYGVLLIALGLAGVAQGWGNPATNKAISTGIELRQRGVITGVKQSGVQLAVFVAGVAMPAIAAAWGWRAGMWIAAAMSAVALAGLVFVTELPESGEVGSEQPNDAGDLTGPIPPFVLQVAIYGFLLGTVGGALGRFLPLYAEEAVGFSPERAGLVFAVSGLVAVPTRIASGLLLDRGVSARLTLMVMAAGAAAAFAAIVAAAEGQDVLLWLGTVISGLTLGSWNTAANLAMIREGRNAGRASGVLIFGFLTGLTLGSPIAGWSIDQFDSYRPAWVACTLLCLAGVAAITHRRPTAESVT